MTQYRYFKNCYFLLRHNLHARSTNGKYLNLCNSDTCIHNFIIVINVDNYKTYRLQKSLVMMHYGLVRHLIFVIK